MIEYKYMKKNNKKIKDRDVEKNYKKDEFIKKLRRLADSLETNKKFSIQIKGHRIHIPKSAIGSLEHERNGKNEEVEFQIKWERQ